MRIGKNSCSFQLRRYTESSQTKRLKSMDWLDTLLTGVIAQGLLLGMVILSLKTGDRMANSFLAAFVLLSSLGLIAQSLGIKGMPVYAIIYPLYVPVILKAPLLYLYIRALSEPDFQLSYRMAVHLLILIPGYLFQIFAWITGGDMAMTSLLVVDVVQNDKRALWFPALINGFAIAYALAALQKLGEHRHFLERHFSQIEEISLGWLKWLIVFFIVMRFAQLGIDFVQIQGMPLPHGKAYAILAMNAVIIYFISFGGLRQPIIFTRALREVMGRNRYLDSASSEPYSSDQPSVANQPGCGEKYQKSGLNDQQIQGMWDKLLTFMTTEQPYKDNELNLPQLAERVAIKPRDLSQLINSQFGSSFYDFINSYRVEAAKALLLESGGKRRKMLDVAMTVGFNSQSTFYAQFKKQCGTTPKKFKDAANKAAQAAR